MKIFLQFHKYAIYLFIFSLNFETMKIFNINFLATKISISILVFFSICNYKSLIIDKRLFRILIPLTAYFLLLTTRNYIHQTPDSNAVFDFLLFLNILIFIILGNYSIKYPQVFLKGLFVFVLSNLIVCLLYFLGIGSEFIKGRVSMLGMNENYLGINMALGTLILISIIFDNKLNFSNRRYWLIMFLPLLMILIVKSGSRGAFLSVFIGLMLFILFNKSIKSYKKVILVLTSFFTLILFYVFFLKDSVIIERLTDSIQNGDTANRDLIWEALTYFFDGNMAFGVGKTGYTNLVGDVSPHNVLLETFLYTGLVGLLIFLIFFYLISKKAFYRLKTGNEILPIILLIPITILLLTGQIFDKKVIWVILAYISGSVISLKKSRTSKVIIKGSEVK